MKKLISEEKKADLRKNLIIILLFLACLSLFYLLFKNVIHSVFQAFLAVFIPALIALFISYICEPVFNIFHERLHIKRAMSVGITAAILVAIVVALLFFIGQFIVQQVILFVQNDWPRVYAWINNWAIEHGFTDMDKILETVQNNMDSIISTSSTGGIIAFIKGVFSSVTGFIVDIVLIFIFFLYFLYGKGKIFKGIIKLLPEKIKNHLMIIGSRSNDVIHSFVKGKFIAILFLSIYFTIAFEIIGLRGIGILFAVLLGFLDIIPIVGPLIGTVFPMLYTFILHDQFYLGMWTPVFILVIDLIGQLLQEKVISPLVIGKSMNINSLLLLSSMVFFSSLFGVLGIVLSIPICGVIKVIYIYLREVFFNDEDTDLNKNISDKIDRIKEENQNDIANEGII